ncbi:ATP-binding protein [Methylocystis bryophila]|uniref:histidine kinase n=1 Tax=Methylocystis bryophila TaxID=655015 RepID=A0A1W6MZ62_9HYPH|nr:ATP-binding protein [Methylocystis bryophila]ARN82826.1 two-component sensor histidine kinase [Methylocystis bryophila]BDV39082.1 two-component sensor histidine kinase [Methylocystis bryophila]
MSSLRKRLFMMLALATSVIWAGAAGWIYIQTKREIEHVLDTRLQEAARMVSSLVASTQVAKSQAAATAPLQQEPSSYQRQLACQLWSFDGRLIARSSGAPEVYLSDLPSGFSAKVIGGEVWRVYAVEDAAKGMRVIVGDRIGLREQLVAHLIEGLLFPALLVVPVLGIFIWTSIGRGLRPLSDLADGLRGRSLEDTSSIDPTGAPREVMPVVDALNGLFAKLATARKHERDVTAFAAHELRTPLAGLKTQAQVALAATEPATKEAALRQILIAVDRSARLVHQLLALAKLDAGMDIEREEYVNVLALLEEIIDGAKWTQAGRRVDADPLLGHITIRANRELIAVALRNLHQNALMHTPSAGRVSWGLREDGTTIFVQDEGPGIPEEELPFVTDRFFRGRHKSSIGSGLGLAIVELALRRIGAALRLCNRSDSHGLLVEISFGKSAHIAD